MTAFGPDRPGGFLGRIYCSAPHPTNAGVWCRRLPDHEGDHRAFVFRISEAEEWANEEVVDVDAD